MSEHLTDAKADAGGEGRMIACEVCGRGMPEGVTLHRQNPTGQPGVWRCTEHNEKDVDPAVQEIIDAIEDDAAQRLSTEGRK